MLTFNVGTNRILPTGVGEVSISEVPNQRMKLEHVAINENIWNQLNECQLTIEQLMVEIDKGKVSLTVNKDLLKTGLETGCKILANIP